MNGIQTLMRAIGFAALLLGLTACDRNDEGRLPADQIATSITGYNHTPDYIHRFYLDDAGGGNVRAYGGGGSFVCCATYARKWHPDMRVKVRWSTSSSDPEATGKETEPVWHEKVVPIEKFSSPEIVNVHFLPKGEVRIVISGKSADHEQYPGPPGPVKPKDWKW